jgi:hypothetical protein
MKEFTGFEYLLIDAANNFGHDKLTFEERIGWATTYLPTLELLSIERGNWKEKPLYLKAVQAIRKAQAGKPTGHLVGLDAVCSGMQIMSALTGCIDGARATGLVDPDRRADAYTELTELMVQDLGYHLPGERAKVKNACMTSLYGSKKEPENEFGENTPELAAFYRAMVKMAPGACELLDDLLGSWQPYALVHEWILPDGYHARVKVMQATTCRIEVDELNHATFTYQYYINEGEKKGVKNAANVIHSIDGYVLRTLARRCNYDYEIVRMASDEIMFELLSRTPNPEGVLTPQVAYYYDHFLRSGMVDVVILDHLTSGDIRLLPTSYLVKLSQIINTMLEHQPFPVVTIHDQFSAHANNMNHVRKHYREILAELADSDLLSDIFSQLHGYPVQYQKLSNSLGATIRQSNYGLC